MSSSVLGVREMGHKDDEFIKIRLCGYLKRKGMTGWSTVDEVFI